MKQSALFLIAACTLISSEVITAQPQKGDRLFEGGIGNLSYSVNQPNVLYSPNYTNYRGYNIAAAIYPGIGYFFSNRAAAGVVLDLSYSNSATLADWALTNTPSVNDRSSNFHLVLTPYFRYYFAGKNANRFYAELHAGIGGGVADSHSDRSYSPNNPILSTSHTNTTSNQYQGGLMLGFNHFFTKNVAFHTAIGPDYNSFHSTTTYSPYPFLLQPVTNVQGNINLSWRFGFTILFPKREKEAGPPEETPLPPRE
jgi:hypothetical protein